MNEPKFSSKSTYSPASFSRGIEGRSGCPANRVPSGYSNSIRMGLSSSYRNARCAFKLCEYHPSQKPSHAGESSRSANAASTVKDFPISSWPTCASASALSGNVSFNSRAEAKRRSPLSTDRLYPSARLAAAIGARRCLLSFTSPRFYRRESLPARTADAGKIRGRFRKQLYSQPLGTGQTLAESAALPPGHLAGITEHFFSLTRPKRSGETGRSQKILRPRPYSVRNFSTLPERMKSLKPSSLAEEWLGRLFMSARQILTWASSASFAPPATTCKRMPGLRCAFRRSRKCSSVARHPITRTLVVCGNRALSSSSRSGGHSKFFSLSTGIAIAGNAGRPPTTAVGYSVLNT